MEESVKSRTRRGLSLVDILKEHLQKPCSVSNDSKFKCNGAWLAAALQTLRLNGIPVAEFREAVKNALIHGRGKGRNLFLVGPSNSAKTFLLYPLVDIYDCFMCPASTTYNFVSAVKKEVILFNDIRYGEKFLPWQDFLNLLDGSKLNVAMPKSHFETDIEWSAKQPIFATSDKRIIRIVNGCVDSGETNQMNKRWKYIEFSHIYKDGEINYDLIPCGRCFAQLILCDESS